MSSAIVSFGETMLRLSPPHSVRLEEAHTFTSYVSGTESNTLAALARLGLETIWVSALPANPLGQRVEAEVRRHGVNTAHVVWSGRDARLGLFYAEEAVNPLGLQVYYDRASSACALIDPEVADYTVVDGARLLHLTGITPAISSRMREVFTRFLQRAREKNVPLSFDVNYRTKLWGADEAAIGIEAACQQADLLFCTCTDAASLWGMTGSAESVLRQMAQRFIGNGTPKTMVLTLGSEGAAELRHNDYRTEPAFLTEGSARFGSGDAFTAGYLYAYLEGPLSRELYEQCGTTALTFGNALAALKRCIAGDIATVTPRDLQNLLQRQGERAFR
jgi:2-dehydro-3-deoxygluconokinase